MFIKHVVLANIFLMLHLGEQIHFGNHYSKTHKAIPKSQLCKNINATLLVDDSLKYARDCASNGIPCIVFGEYAWNRGEVIYYLHLHLIIVIF